MPFFANFLVYKYCAQTTNACGWLSEPCAASGGLQIRLRQTPHSTWILTHIDCDKHPTARVFWHTPFRTNTTTAHVFFVDTVDCLNECVSIWLLGWVNCYWVLKSFDEKLLSVVEWWVCGGCGGAASPAPLPSLIERHCCWRRWRWWLGSTLGSKLQTLFLSYFYPLRIKCLNSIMGLHNEKIAPNSGGCQTQLKYPHFLENWSSTYPSICVDQAFV